MTFSFSTTVPATNNDPSVDQPVMLANNVSEAGIWEVDHIGFNAQNGGTHKQVNYITTRSAPTPVDPASMAYTNVGIDSPTHPQNYFTNSQGTFPLSSIRAFGNFVVNNAAGNVVPTNSFNLIAAANAIVQTGNGSGVTSFAITLKPNVLNSTNAIVFVMSGSSAATFNYSLSSAVTLTIQKTNTSSIVGSTVNFLIIQI